MNLFIPGNSRILTLCEVEVYGEGEIKQADLVFWETINGFTIVEMWQFTGFEHVKRLGYVRNPRSLMEGTETLCRDDIGDLLGSPEHL